VTLLTDAISDLNVEIATGDAETKLRVIYVPQQEPLEHSQLLLQALLQEPPQLLLQSLQPPLPASIIKSNLKKQQQRFPLG
jgi:hypothetical protein